MLSTWPCTFANLASGMCPWLAWSRHILHDHFPDIKPFAVQYRSGGVMSPYASSRSASDSGLRTDAATLSPPRPRAPSFDVLVTTARVIILPQDLKDGAEDVFSGPRRERTVDHLRI